MKTIKIDDRIELRQMRPEYAAEIAALVVDSFDHLTTWLPWVNDDYTPGTTIEFIKNAMVQAASRSAFQTAVFVEEKIVGGIGFNNIDKINRAAEIGYWLGVRNTGNGIMTRCCAAIVEFGFEEFGLHRIVIRCATENTKSQAIPIRLGFTAEGISREAEKLHDKYVDLKVFSLLADEREPADHSN